MPNFKSDYSPENSPPPEGVSSELVVAEIVGDGSVSRKAGKQINGRPSKRSLQAAQKTLNDNQLRLAVWLSMPSNLRVPRTRQELAAEFGVTETTVYRWSQIPDVVMATRWLQLQHAGDVGRVANVLDFLYNTTQDSSLWMKDRLSAAKEWLKAVGVYEAWNYDNELLKMKQVDDFDLDSLSDDELWDLYNQRAASLKEVMSGDDE
jgi:hypothetical protein